MTVGQTRDAAHLIGAALAIAAIVRGWLMVNGNNADELHEATLNTMLMLFAFIVVELVQRQHGVLDAAPAFEAPPEWLSLNQRWLFAFLHAGAVWPPFAFVVSWLAL